MSTRIIDPSSPFPSTSWNKGESEFPERHVRALGLTAKVLAELHEEAAAKAVAQEAQIKELEARAEKALSLLSDYADECEFLQSDEAGPARKMLESARRELATTPEGRGDA